MADDDIEALLRQVESSLNPGAPAPSSANVPAAQPPTSEQPTKNSGDIVPALIAGAVGAGGVWLAITFLQGLKWLAVIVAFVVTVFLWLRRD